MTALTTILASQEQDLLQQRWLRFEARLEPPSNDQLFGVAEVLEKLTTLLYDTSGTWMIALEGMGGIGKTSLANRLIRQAIAGSHFEEFGWISARRHRLGVNGTLLPMLAPTLTSDHLIEALARQLLDESELPLPFSVEKALVRLQARFKQAPHLVVIDNLETVEHLERLLVPLQRLINPSKFVLTTRHNLHNEFAPYQFVVPPLSFAPAAQLIRHDARRIGFTELATADDADLRPIYAKVGGNPLALRLVVGQMRVHSLPTVLKNLQTAQGTALEQLYDYIFQDAWQALNETNRQVWLAMLLLPENGGEIQQIAEITEQEVSTIAGVLDHLASLNLIEQRGNLFERCYTLHSLTRTFLQQIAER